MAGGWVAGWLVGWVVVVAGGWVAGWLGGWVVVRKEFGFDYTSLYKILYYTRLYPLTGVETK